VEDHGQVLWDLLAGVHHLHIHTFIASSSDVNFKIMNFSCPVPEYVYCTVIFKNFISSVTKCSS
jgi:hypothetical protein